MRLQLPVHFSGFPGFSTKTLYLTGVNDLPVPALCGTSSGGVRVNSGSSLSTLKGDLSAKRIGF